MNGRQFKLAFWAFWAFGAFCACAVAAFAVFAREVRIHDLAPRMIAPYIERRAEGHDPLIEQGATFLARLLIRLDRGAALPVPQRDPDWIGAQPDRSDSQQPGFIGRQVEVADAASALRALTQAVAGDVIVFAPGSYRFSGTGIDLTHPGRADAPIVVRAKRLGTVTIEFDALEGFHVMAPYWRFENLVVQGVCRHHDDCDHAFHIVGGADHVVLRNNVLRDFNAQVKINGEGGRFPDDGRIEGNTLVDRAPRNTDHAVTPIDLVAANHWTIAGNFIADFIKLHGDGTSYGAFAKGAGTGNRFVRNVVACEYRFRGLPGVRVGLSFGGGGTGPSFCRDRRCAVEQELGVMADNLIASCSDDGIYLNRSAQTRVAFNTVFDTAGVMARFPQTFANMRGNLVEGPLAVRDGARIDDRDNQASALIWNYLGVHPVRRQFENARLLDLRWASAPARLRARADSGPDLCGTPRTGSVPYGALVDFRSCTDRVPSPASKVSSTERLRSQS